jgi:nucleoside-diphosphate-sugar epimerase
MVEGILITGGAGFIGSNLALLFSLATVIALDNPERSGSERQIDCGWKLPLNDLATR